MKVAIYCRVSTDYQELDRQVNELTSMAERMDYKVYGIYKEIISGAKTRRLERDKVLELIKKKRIDAVLVTELSRWGRNAQDLIETVELMKSRNVSLLTTSGYEFNLTTATGNLLFQLMAVFAEFERGLISERVKSGMAEAARKGKQIHRPKGGRNKKTSNRKRQIIEMYEKGETILYISERLNISRPTIYDVLKKEGIFKDKKASDLSAIN